MESRYWTGNRLSYREPACMKCFRSNPLLIGLAALFIITGLVAWTVMRELRQEAKDRALIAAVKQEDANAVVHLLNEGADANAKYLPKDARPFWRVCWDMLQRRRQGEGAPTALMILFTPMPSPVAPDLLIASVPDLRIVKALLAHGATPNVLDRGGCSILAYALDLHDANIALLLMQHGAQLADTVDGSTEPLIVEAAGQSERRVLEAMLARGADINARNRFGITVLMRSADFGNVANVRFLLARHANLATMDEGGTTALDHALSNAKTNPSSLEAKLAIRVLRLAGAH